LLWILFEAHHLANYCDNAGQMSNLIHRLATSQSPVFLINSRCSLFSVITELRLPALLTEPSQPNKPARDINCAVSEVLV